MELQLGLSLQSTHTHTKGFDLNSKGFEGEDQMVTINNNNGCYKFDMIKKKRSFIEAFDYGGGDSITKTLFPLLSLNGHPNEEDDDGNGRKKRVNHAIHKDEGEAAYGLVGWPPIKLWRRKMFHGNDQGRRIGGDHDDRTAHNERRKRRKSMYVKVNMEGVGIGRKIDLRLFHSYHSLANTLITMFSINKKIKKDGEPYALLYQDDEGDWLLAGDVPWQTFIETVQRMEILRNAG
ncbi:hypothetical protein LguiB_027580 [Lonicera macranthoides]